MAGVQAELKIIVYGSSARDSDDLDERFNDENGGENQRRLELTVRPIIPNSAMVSMEEKRLWVGKFITSITLDVKHSRNWRCEFCSPYNHIRIILRTTNSR